VARFRHVPPSEHATVHPRARRGRPASLSGAVGRAVSVEVHVSNGLRGFTIVDRPDAAVREARDRVRAAILSSARAGRCGGSRSTLRLLLSRLVTTG